MDPLRDVLGLTADYAAQFLGTLDERPIRADDSITAVSNWQTSAEDVERSVAAILEAAAAVSGTLR